MTGNFLWRLTTEKVCLLSALIALDIASLLTLILFSDLLGDGFFYILMGAIFEGMLEIMLPPGMAIAIARWIPLLLLTLCLYPLVDVWIQRSRTKLQ